MTASQTNKHNLSADKVVTRNVSRFSNYGVLWTPSKIWGPLQSFGGPSDLQSTRLRPRLYGEKLSRVEGSPAYPSYPGRANFSYISLQNLANRLHEKQKVGSARRVTLLAGTTFLHINTFFLNHHCQIETTPKTSRKTKILYTLQLGSLSFRSRETN